MTKSTKRKSFILHIDSLDVLDDLTDKQAGALFKAIKAHHKGAEVALDAITKIAFSPLKNQFIRDDEKYRITCEQRAAAGSKGGKQKVANASKSKQEQANLADSDNKSDSDSKKDNKTKSIPAGAVDYSVFGMSDDQIGELIRIRKVNKGGKITQRVANTLSKEFHDACAKGYTFDQLLDEWETRGWKSFKAEWMASKNNGQRSDAVQRTIDNLNSVELN